MLGEGSACLGMCLSFLVLGARPRAARSSVSRASVTVTGCRQATARPRSVTRTLERTKSDIKRWYSRAGLKSPYCLGMCFFVLAQGACPWTLGCRNGRSPIAKASRAGVAVTGSEQATARPRYVTRTSERLCLLDIVCLACLPGCYG